MAATTNSNPASGAAVSLGIIPEAVFGVTPALPSLVEVRATSVAFGKSPEHFVSQEVNANRIVKEIRKVYTGPTFQIRGELNYGNLDALFEGLLLDEWTGDVLTEKNTFKSFTMEKSYSDAATPFFERITGAVVVGLSLQIDGTGGNAVQFTLTGIAKTWDTSETSLDADGYTAANTNPAMVAAQCSVSIDDSAVTVPSVSLDVSASMEQLRAIGSDGPAHIAPNGNRSVTAQVVSYLADRTELERFKNETAIDLDITLADAATNPNSYVIALPVCKVNGEPQVDDGTGVLRVTSPLQATDPTGTAHLTITRAAAA